MKHKIQKVELFIGVIIFLGGLLTYGLGVHQLLPVPRPDLVVYGTTLIGIILIFMGCDIFSKPTKEMQILENDERNIAITNASLANAYKVTLTLLVLVLFALVFMGYMSKVVFFSIAGVIAIGQITWVITARYLDKNICYIALLTLFLELFVLVVPRITSMIVDDISNKLGYEIQKYALCTVAIIFVYFIASIMRKRIILHTQLRIYHQIIKKMLTKLFGLDLSFFQSHMTGDIVNRLNSVSSINDFISNVFITFAIDFITAIVCGIAMTLMNPILFFTVICITIIQIVLISIIRRGITLDTQLYQGEQSKLQSDLVDLIANLVSIKCMGIDFQMNNKINTSYNKNIDILYRKEKKSDLLECVITTISLVTSLIIYIVGGYFVERQELSLGELVQFVSLATFFIVPFKSISVYMPQFSTIREMIERIKEVLFYKEVSNDGKINLNRFEKLEMKGVYFGYAANETLLKDININVYAGNKIAIVGPSGSGKTSITKLMMNIFDTYEGHILINGVEIDKINRESYYKKLAVVTQQPLAFNDTIRKNIDPSETLDDNQIYEVLKQAELYDEIMQFPLKLNTKIGENGQNISGGQKQRIAIARALASNPSIVIFDEGTSNLDSVTEKSIFENLNEKGITQIIISHRLSTTQDADYIYVIKDGKIVESGKHDELIKKMGVYYQNYTSYQ